MVCNQSLDNQMTKTWNMELTTEANEESFVIILQHGGNDVTCKPSIVSDKVESLTSYFGNRPGDRENGVWKRSRVYPLLHLIGIPFASSNYFHTGILFISYLSGMNLQRAGLKG